MCVNVSYSSLPESLGPRLAAVFGMKPGEVARFEEHPLQVEYLDNGTALVYVTKVVLTDAAALQHLLSIDGRHRHPEMFTLRRIRRREPADGYIRLHPTPDR